MMRPVILVATLTKTLQYDPMYDYIGIDQGAYFCMTHKIPMVVALGDFDSINKKQKEQLEQYTKVIALSPVKNNTDSEFALQYAHDLGYEEIILYGAIGGRIDHEIANLRLLEYSDIAFVLMNESNRICVLEKGKYHIKKEYQYLSIFACAPSIVTLQNVAYPLKTQKLDRKDIYTVSNEIKKEAIIEILEGKIFMIESKDEK